MYHSVTFDSINSYEDWHLVPDSRPVIAMPEVKTNYVEIPGVSGKLDLSETLTKYPVYNNRTGSLKFHVLNDHEPWQQLYHKIANYIHGKPDTRIILEDDPDYYYKGRVKVAEWTSNNDGTWSDISFDYELDPYKYYNTEYSRTINLTAASQTINFTTDDVGSMPIVPKFTYTNAGVNGLNINFTNSELGITNRHRNTSVNGEYEFYDLILTKRSVSSTCKMVLTGNGTVVVHFRRGDL